MEATALPYCASFRTEQLNNRKDFNVILYWGVSLLLAGDFCFGSVVS
jgi:hypothetical protein